MLARLPEPVQRAATFAYITGWRIDSEVLSLEWRQVDFGAGEVRLDPGKTKKGEGRTFPTTRDLREVLEQQKAITENLQRQLKVVYRVYFTARVGRSKASALRFGRRARKLDVPVGSYTTSVEPPSQSRPRGHS